jgi:hypothetical protein
MAKLMHQVTVEYYTSDDGIWLHCATCHWTKNLGFSPKPFMVMNAYLDHMEDTDDFGK